ncbi:MAG TPA: alkaline phosphatase family protein [Nocardioides sp.]|nr:alkaline phosphatase family protein [Nocardioides sp.]
MRGTWVVLAVGGLLAVQSCSAGDQTAHSEAPGSESPLASPSVSGSHPTHPTHSRRAASRSHAPSRAGSPSTPTAHRADLPTKVLVVIEENHSFDQMRSGMPYLAGLSERYGYATQWHAITHPSEPNYLAIAGGSTFGITDDEPPADNAPEVGQAPSVFSEALNAGKTAATYADAMPTPCALADAYPYAVRHNPWTYFASQRAACAAHDRAAESFVDAASNNRLPDVGFLIPDMLHDAHDGSLAAADAWLRTQLTPVLASTDFTSGRLVVVVTADEDDRHSDNRVLTSVLTPRVNHEVVDAPLTHYSLSRFIAQVLGVAPLGQAADAPDMVAAFGL